MRQRRHGLVETVEHLCHAATRHDHGVRTFWRCRRHTDNARWFYDFSVPGDVVEVINTGGEPLQVRQNGNWSVTWSQWVQGSALT